MAIREMEVSIGMAHSNKHEGIEKVTLRIEDRLSGEVIADFEFRAQDWLAIERGLHTSWDGFSTDHPERIGKKRNVTMLMVDKEYMSKVDYREQGPAAETWAIKNTPDGTELRYVNNTNQGWKAVYDSWEE